MDTVEFPNGAEHFCHELYSYLRSPYRELKGYDGIVQVCYLGPRVMISGLIESPSTILYHLLDHQLARHRQQGDVHNLVQSPHILLTYPTLTLLDHPRVQSVLVLVLTIAIDHLHADTLPPLSSVPALGLDVLRGEEEPVRTMRMNMITRGIVILSDGGAGVEGVFQIEGGNTRVQEEERRDFGRMSSKGYVTENEAQGHIRGLMEEACGHGAVTMAGVKSRMNARNGPKRSKG